MSTNEDLQKWAAELRLALAAIAPLNPTVAEAVRAQANAAREAHTLTVELLQDLVAELTAAKAQHRADHARLVSQPTPRPNKYRKPCERCEEWVEAGEGVLERSEDDKRWMVSHKEGECPVQMFDGVPTGRYAIDWEGDNNVEFYQVRKGALYAQASAELFRITDRERIAKVLDAIKADPKAASILYGMTLGECGVCGRTLTNQESREAGIGPICSGKMGW
jgi:hypothetical protein